MTEFESQPTPEVEKEAALMPEDKHGVEEDQARLALDKAVDSGYMTAEDVGDYLGVHPEDILTGVSSYIEMAGDDAERVMSEWGLIEPEDGGKV